MSLRKTAIVAFSTIAALGAMQAAQASSIGINFAGGTNPGDFSLVGNLSAGVVAQTNWNDLQGHATSIAANTLKDDQGNLTGVSAGFYVAGGSPYISSNSFGSGTGDKALMGGGLESLSYFTPLAAPNFPSQVQNLKGITYGDFDVYVYFNAGSNDVTDGTIVTLAINSGPGSGAGTILYKPINNPGSYIAADNVATDAADYAVFHITGATDTTTMTIKQGFASSYTGRQVGLNAIQIVSAAAAPEPGALAFLSLAVVPMLRRHRR